MKANIVQGDRGGGSIYLFGVLHGYDLLPSEQQKQKLMVEVSNEIGGQKMDFWSVSLNSYEV